MGAIHPQTEGMGVTLGMRGRSLGFQFLPVVDDAGATL